MKPEPLACPFCKCPLQPPGGQATGMTCPRCNTWLEFDPLCPGTCLACHKLHQENPEECIEEKA